MMTSKHYGWYLSSYTQRQLRVRNPQRTGESTRPVVGTQARTGRSTGMEDGGQAQSQQSSVQSWPGQAT